MGSRGDVLNNKCSLKQIWVSWLSEALSPDCCHWSQTNTSCPAAPGLSPIPWFSVTLLHFLYQSQHFCVALLCARWFRSRLRWWPSLIIRMWRLRSIRQLWKSWGPSWRTAGPLSTRTWNILSRASRRKQVGEGCMEGGVSRGTREHPWEGPCCPFWCSVIFLLLLIHTAHLK